MKINGILLINKPSGPTSNLVLQKVKKIFSSLISTRSQAATQSCNNTKQRCKAGHTGSLDPLATGMLPICFGEATKFSQYLLNADKCYQVTGLLGIKTDSADATGNIIAVQEKFSITKEQLQNTINKFIGTVTQIPSMFSALKHHGKPLYQYARAGIEIDRAPRIIKIHSITLDSFVNNTFKLTVHCSKGTYIRNLIEDIGENLGVHAHVVALHRVFTAGFVNETMYDLEYLATSNAATIFSCLLPLDRAVADFPQIVIDVSQAQALKHGKTINCTANSTFFAAEISGNNYNAGTQGIKVDNYVRLYTEPSNFLGLGEISSSGQIKAKRLLS